MSIQNRTSDGCVALSYQKDVDIIVVGNSHTYANIDPYILSQGVGGKSVGVCAMASWNGDFMEPFLDYLQVLNITPETIIWLIDDSAFLEFGNQAARAAYRDAVFTDTVFRNKTAASWRADDSKFERVSRNAYLEKRRAMASDLSRIPEDKVAQIINTRPLPNFTGLENAVKTLSPMPDIDRAMSSLCKRMDAQGIRFISIATPLPHYTRRMFERAAPLNQFGQDENVAAFVSRYAQCLSRVESRSLEDWGLNITHFVNRFGYADYPYEIWDNPEQFDEKFETLDATLQKQLVDPDHLNPIGAQIFTREVTGIITAQTDKD